MKQGSVFSRFQWESNCVRRQLIQGDAALLPLPVGEGWGEGSSRLTNSKCPTTGPGALDQTPRQAAMKSRESALKHQRSRSWSTALVICRPA